MAPTTYYALLNPDVGRDVVVRDDIENLTHGDTDSMPRVAVVSQPRQAPMTIHGDLLDLLAMGACLARLTPQGEVKTTTLTPTTLHTCAAGWRVTGWENLDAFLGPQAQQIRNMVAKIGDLEDGPVADAYDTAINAQYDDSGWTARRHVHAARKALEAAGGDGMFWAEFAAPCNVGGEFIAVAARDLIHTVPGWTWDAYATLVEPWRAAFGEGPHPQDKFRIAR